MAGVAEVRGLVEVTSRSALLDVPGPLGADVREVVLAELAARVGRASSFLDEDDRVAWKALLDRASPVWLGDRDDLALLTARTLHIGNKAWGIMTDERQAGIRGAFDAAAADFTALGRHLWDPIGRTAVGLADPRPGERVLDACCGTGASAIPSARLVGPAGLVDAVDLSAPMVEELRRLSADIPALHAHQADVTTWEPDGYDVVQSALGIFFFPDMTAGTDHLISRARPGGRVVFTIWRGDSMARPAATSGGPSRRSWVPRRPHRVRPTWSTGSTRPTPTRPG